MKRSRYLVAYDIRDTKRLRKVHKTVKGFGDTMQYSVFVCDLTSLELTTLMGALLSIIDKREDRVALVALGDANDRTPFTFLGDSLALPFTGLARVV